MRWWCLGFAVQTSPWGEHGSRDPFPWAGRLNCPLSQSREGLLKQCAWPTPGISDGRPGGPWVVLGLLLRGLQTEGSAWRGWKSAQSYISHGVRCTVWDLRSTFGILLQLDRDADVGTPSCRSTPNLPDLRPCSHGHAWRECQLMTVKVITCVEG